MRLCHNSGMSLQFTFDPRKAAANLRKHGVSLQQASSVFGDGFAQTFPDEFHSEDEQRFITLGVSSDQQLLFVSHQEFDDGVIRIIGARHVTHAERKTYEELQDHS